MRKFTLSIKQRHAKRVEATTSNLKGFLLPAVLLVFMGLMLAFPTHYFEGTKKGLAIFSSSVLPAIFPFAFLSTLMAKTEVVKDVSKAFEKPFRFLFGVSNYGAFVLFSALICGYPVGAVTTFELYNKGLISTEEAKSYIPISSTASPIFILATVGGALFEDMTVGVIILLSHYLGTFLNGILWGLVNKSRGKLKQGAEDKNAGAVGALSEHMRVRARVQNNNNENLVGGAVVKSVSSMLVVGGYLVLFGLVVDTLELLPFANSLPYSVKGILYSYVEMSRGVAMARSVSAKWFAVAIATFAVTFGGLSVNLQNYHYLSMCNCSLKEVILPKFSQGILGFLCAIIFSIFFFNIFGIKG